MKKDKSKDAKSKKSKSKVDDNKSDKSKSKSKSKPKEAQKKPSKSPSKQVSKKGGKSKKSPADQSEISSISQSPMASADCIHHKSPFINFCETCEELVCNQCTVFGPHNNHLHRILKMTDAYRLRKFYLVEAIRSNLVDKRDKIIAQLHRLQYRIEEIRFVKNIIQRDIRSQYSGILERLRNFQGVKLATLTHEVSLVQRELDTINQLGNQFFELTNMQCDKLQQQRKMNRFLVRSKEMYESIEYITSRAERVPPQLGLQDIPREVESNRDTVKKALSGREINSFKNEILWKLVTDYRAQQNGLRRDVEQRATGALKQLSQQVETLNERLKQYKLVCFFCSVSLNAGNVNEACDSNTSNEPVETKQGFEKTPPANRVGNRRHFFTKLVQD